MRRAGQEGSDESRQREPREHTAKGSAPTRFSGPLARDGSVRQGLQLDPAKGLTGKLLLPKVWKKEGLAYEKVHELKVKQPLPATAISITKLDPWFLPGEEACDIGYSLEGVKARVQKVAFHVYASNYAKATASNVGDFVKYSYAATPDEKIVKRSGAADVDERKSDAVPEWKGESEAADGILHKRTGKPRYINAASAPYSVNLLYYKTDGQNDATNTPSCGSGLSGRAGPGPVPAGRWLRSPARSSGPARTFLGATGPAPGLR